MSVPFFTFRYRTESTILLNLQIHNGRRYTHAMAHELQQSHLCGIVELSSARPSVSCLFVPRIRKVDCKDGAQPTPEAGLDLLHYKGKKHPYQPALPMEWAGFNNHLVRLSEEIVCGWIGHRILSIREMVFTLCLILILDPFISTNTMGDVRIAL